MATKPNAPSALRNQNAILDVICDEFENFKVVLEIGSGTGQHAVFFASQIPWLTWQTSDLAVNHGGINAWLEDANLDNVKFPLVLDVTEPLQTNDNLKSSSAAPAPLLSPPTARREKAADSPGTRPRDFAHCKKQ